MVKMRRMMMSKFEEEFEKFLKKWTGDNFPHLVDTDENDGQRIRDLVSRQFEEGYRLGLEDLSSFIITTMPDADQDGFRRIINAISSSLLKQFRVKE